MKKMMAEQRKAEGWTLYYAVRGQTCAKPPQPFVTGAGDLPVIMSSLRGNFWAGGLPFAHHASKRDGRALLCSRKAALQIASYYEDDCRAHVVPTWVRRKSRALRVGDTVVMKGKITFIHGTSPQSVVDVQIDRGDNALLDSVTPYRENVRRVKA